MECQAPVVGIENNNYWKTDKDAFKAAIDAAKAVNEDSNATQQRVDNAVNALNTAKAAFEASVITPATGDINNSSTIDVGDLAIVAYYYGAKSDSENWATSKVADINKDNKVNIEDLALVAYRVLDKQKLVKRYGDTIIPVLFKPSYQSARLFDFLSFQFLGIRSL